ncbi:MAG: 5-deoxy-glucuronate isomerase, partial [Wenzhouxiangella sp.]|nr:5-deoxy-glucuronate isomerase [Wenzhouxiangella sp.]
MTDLHRKPTGETGKVHDITPEGAGWRYVGFGLHRLAAGAVAAEPTGDREAILVLVDGKARLSVGGEDFGELGHRLSPFDWRPPHALYAPPGTDWRAEASTDCTLAVCTAPSPGGRPAQWLGPEGVVSLARGKGSNTRHIHNIAMEDQDVADSLLVTEVLTPDGNWSSYPGHRHDEDAFPDITYLEETYYHRLDPAAGWAVQRVYTEDGSLDACMAVRDGDVTLVPRGHHPCGAPYGFRLYYLNVMAGPLRKWRFKPDPEHAWIMARD